MDYKDVYNDLIDRTHGLTDISGFYDISDKAELQIALDILKSAYSSVQWTGLVHDADDPNGNDYRLRFSDPILEEQVKYEPNNDISESKQMNEAMIEKHDTLNPKLWDDNNELKPEVRQKVEEIVDKFKENLEDDEVKLDVKDICLIGSNASYNYNPTSDLDIHIICDPSVYSDEDLANKIYLAYKSLWNNKYDPTFDGIEVELYVEPYEVHANSKGIYSLNDGWLKEPEAEDIPEIDENEIAILAEPFEERYEKVMQGESIEDIDNLIDDIYLQRQESIMKDGEFADGNLVFKLLRSRGRIQDLRDRKVELENKEMSITEDNFNSNLESILIEEGLVEDTIDNDFFNLEPGQVYRLGDDHTIKINDVKNDVVSCTEIDGDETYDWEDAYFPVQSMLFEYDATLEESVNEDTVKQGDKWVNKGKEGTHGKFKTKKAADAQRKAMFANGYKEGLNEFLVDYDGRGMEFSFPDPKDTLAVYLDWEGIYGYNDDIINFAEAGYDDLEAYLEEEGIYGYTQKIYNILNGEPAWCSGMNQEDFESICRANYIDPQSANDDVDIDDDVPSELPVNADDEDYLDDRDESLKEGYSRLSKKFNNIEDARKFVKFLDKDLEPRIETSNTEDENGNVVTSYEVYYWDQQDFHDDEFDEDLGGTIPDDEWDNLTDDEKEILNKNRRVDYPDEIPFESLNENADRHVERGINWTWFYTDSEDDANKWFFELMGVKPNKNTIDGPVKRNHPGKFDSYWSFRMRNDLVDQLDFDINSVKNEALDDDIDWDKLHDAKEFAMNVEAEGNDFYSYDIEEFGKKFGFDFNTADKVMKRIRMGLEYKDFFKKENPLTHDEMDFGFLDEAKYLGSCDDNKQIKDEKKKGLVKKDKKSKYDIKADESLDNVNSLKYGDNKKFKEGNFEIESKDGELIATDLELGDILSCKFADKDGFNKAKAKIKRLVNESLNEEIKSGQRFVSPEIDEILVVDGPREDGQIRYHYEDNDGNMVGGGTFTIDNYSMLNNFLKSRNFKNVDESLNEGLTSNDITLDQIKELPVGTIMGIDVLEDPDDPHFKDRDNYFEYRKLEDGWHTFVDGKDWFDEPSDDYTVFMALTNLNAPRVYSIDIKESTNEDLRDELINHGANEVDTLGSMGSKNGGSVSLFYNKPKELYYVIEGPVEKKPAHEFARNNFYNLAPDTMEALKKHPEYIRFTSKDKGEAIKFIKDNYNSGWVIGEDLNEEVDPNDPKAQALALYLNVTTDAIDNGYNNGIYEIGNEEYFVGTEEEAHDMAVSEVKMSYDDMGLDAFTPKFQEWILDNAIDTDAVSEFVNSEIDYFTNEEPDQNMVDYLNGLTDEAQYVKDTLGPDTFRDWAKDKIDLDKVAEEAIEEDGVAHFIAYYDGNEIDLGDGLYAYRLN